jgi:GNAT superfamily N-acetyltransferase
MIGVEELGMAKKSRKKKDIIRNLGDGLILRRSTIEDAEALGKFNAQLHSDEGPDKPDEKLEAWTLDLIEGSHPTFSPEDFTIVEDTKDGKIVSTLNLIPQTWSYDGIEFGVGRPELVGTLPEYRKRGLIRAQFEVVHEWSAERGDKLQAITGIPYYYRQFGYEMCPALGGGRLGYRPHVPKLKKDEGEVYNIRPATEDDLGFIAELYKRGCRRSMVNCRRDETIWRFELVDMRENNVHKKIYRIIETPEGEGIGFLIHPPYMWGPTMIAEMYELAEGIPWGAVTPSVVRYLQATGDAYKERDQKENEKAEDEVGEARAEAFGFWLGDEHPVYEVISDKLPRVRKPYAWYVRVADLPDFLMHIKPVLEERLADSPMTGHSGELKITFYRHGMRIVFEDGRINQVETWDPEPHGGSGDAGFPDLTMLQLIFGYRSLDELKYAFVDCFSRNDDAKALLEIMFPKRYSSIWGVN